MNGAQSDETISSLVDCWIQIRDIEMNGERNKGLYIMKSRGMYHSNQVREFIISDSGLYLEDVYLGVDGVLTGSAREAHKLHMETTKYLQGKTTANNKKNMEEFSELNRQKMIRYRSNGSSRNLKKKK